MYKLSNKSFILLILLSCIFTSSCNKVIYTEGFVGNGTFVNSPNKGVITMNVQGVGRSRKQREYNAVNNALKILIYQGLPGSGVAETGLVRYNTGEENAANSVFKKMFESNKHLSFIVQINDVGNVRRTSEIGGVSARLVKKSVDYSVGVNYEALRRYMEDQNVIRKFGF